MDIEREPGDRPHHVERSHAGLCTDCTHCRSIPSDRGSIFYLCSLSASNPGFPKYPRLPVLQCDGYRFSGSSHARPEGDHFQD
jgi:hypothetical protein